MRKQRKTRKAKEGKTGSSEGQVLDGLLQGPGRALIMAVGGLAGRAQVPDTRAPRPGGRSPALGKPFFRGLFVEDEISFSGTGLSFFGGVLAVAVFCGWRFSLTSPCYSWLSPMCLLS